MREKLEIEASEHKMRINDETRQERERGDNQKKKDLRCSMKREKKEEGQEH